VHLLIQLIVLLEELGEVAVVMLETGDQVAVFGERWKASCVQGCKKT